MTNRSWLDDDHRSGSVQHIDGTTSALDENGYLGRREDLLKQLFHPCRFSRASSTPVHFQHVPGLRPHQVPTKFACTSDPASASCPSIDEQIEWLPSIEEG